MIIGKFVDLFFLFLSTMPNMHIHFYLKTPILEWFLNIYDRPSHRGQQSWAQGSCWTIAPVLDACVSALYRIQLRGSYKRHTVKQAPHYMTAMTWTINMDFSAPVWNDKLNVRNLILIQCQVPHFPSPCWNTQEINTDTAVWHWSWSSLCLALHTNTHAYSLEVHICGIYLSICLSWRSFIHTHTDIFSLIHSLIHVKTPWHV